VPGVRSTSAARFQAPLVEEKTMRRSTRQLALAIAITASQGALAQAAPPDPTIGVNPGSTGSVQRCNASPVSGVAVVVCGTCTYHALLTNDNVLIVNYGGAATALSKDPGTQVVATSIECSIENGLYQQSASALATGPAAAVADSTQLSTTGPMAWPVRPVTVCVDAFAVAQRGAATFHVPLGRTCAVPD
jgi:hypothetical protein